ncbi:MAG: tripartite tricarboxylate transporter substrate-binding protein [Beijerinckiaceae bacterium]|nr:tripartite tricarboxylate transporter substrate-binding protein [Beijerinckiaceae bacterium]
MTIQRRTLLAAACVFALASGAGAALAQSFPAKPITLIVPAAAGGPTDTVARLVAESMSKTLGQTVLVENLGGAGGTIGMRRLAKAAPDGYTVGVWHIAHATAPSLYNKLPYNVVEDFDHIGRITDVPMTLVSRADLPVGKVEDLINWMRREKDKISYGHAGTGSASHLCMVMLTHQLGIQLTGIPYRGTGPAMNDLLSGKFDIMCDQTTNTTNQIANQKIKGFAVTTKARVSSLPDLPTLDSAGIKGFDVSAWHAMWAPKGLPADVATKLNAALLVALKDAKVVERFAALGTAPVSAETARPEALRTHLAAEVKAWGAALKGIAAN